MICQHFIHVGIGSTGEGTIRNALQRNLIGRRRLKLIDGRAHMSLRWSHKHLREKGYEEPFPPSFTFIRNPFHWRISFYIDELQHRRYRGTFRDFCLKHRTGYLTPEYDTGPGVRLIDYWRAMQCDEVNFVGRFEEMKEGFIDILPKLMPDLVTEEEVRGWFPDAYTYWKGRPWVECIEQWMCEELYTPDLIERVYDEDAFFFDRFGYRFEDRYEFD